MSAVTDTEPRRNLSLRSQLVRFMLVGVVSAILYKIVDLTVGLRVSVEAERQGLDLSSHGEAAYHS